MKRFKYGQRVHVQKDADGQDIGISGTVTRLLRANPGAWVRLDHRHDRCPFPADDATRATNVQTYPEYCTPLGRAASPAPASEASP